MDELDSYPICVYRKVQNSPAFVLALKMEPSAACKMGITQSKA